MEFISSLSDDQKALLGCAVAFVACVIVLSVTGLIGGRSSQTRRNASVDGDRETGETPIHGMSPRRASHDDKRSRKAA